MRKRTILNRDFVVANVTVCADTGCWNWNHYRTKDGYGQRKIGNRTYKMHRVSYELFVGPIPEGLHVLHKCDNPACCNPDHLMTGTHSDNMKDMWSKNRHPNPKPGMNAKLTKDEVEEIRALKGKTTGYALCKKYGVIDQTIYNIWNGVTWKEAV